MAQLKSYQILLLIVVVTVLLWLFSVYGGLGAIRSKIDLRIEEQEFEGKWSTGQSNKFTSNWTKQVSMLTYNIWFGEFQMRERMIGIGKIIEELKPNIITLNEVTEQNLSLLKSQVWFARYKLLPPDRQRVESYFVVTLTDMPVKKWKVYPFKNSNLGRKLLVVELQVPFNSGNTVIPFTIATSHLESLDFNTKEREQQLSKSIQILSVNSNTCLMGDLNLEQKVDGEIVLPKPWQDAWLSLSGNIHENGYTWDPTVNEMVKNFKDGSTKDRFDRVFCKLSDFQVHSMKIVGMNQLSSGVFPSDHFGLFTVLTRSVDLVAHENLAVKTKENDVVFKRPNNWKKFLRADVKQ